MSNQLEICQNFIPSISNKHRMLPLGRWLVIDGAGGPFVVLIYDGLFFAGIYHWLYRKDHACSKGSVNLGAVMRNLGWLMKAQAHTVAYKLRYYAAVVILQYCIAYSVLQLFLLLQF